jgi:hypothetical protein
MQSQFDYRPRCLLVHAIKNIIQSYVQFVSRSQQEQTSNNEFEKLQDKPFWIWNVDAGIHVTAVQSSSLKSLNRRK